MKKRDTILIVDDVELNRVILRSIFEGEYQFLEAENGKEAISLLKLHYDSIAVVLLDLVMPVMNGYQMMERARSHGLLAEVPVIIITAEDSVENEVKAFDLGASDIIMKPFEPHVVKRRVQNAVELNLRRMHQQELIDEQAMQLRESNSIMIDALSSIIEYRSVETGQHIRRIRLFTEVLLRNVFHCYPQFGLSEKKISIIASASVMHDIGKIAIPDSILNKPGRLTKEEFDIMKTHTTKGCEMLATLERMSDKEYLQYAYNICRYHHERWDGRGYPDGLKGDSIPICAQVAGIADCYDALTTDRVYKKAIPPEQAFNMILNGECGMFSPKLLECFKNVKSAFAELSKEYADGNVHKAEAMRPQSPVISHQKDSLDTLQMGQLKYFSLLRYIDATVMEIDLNSGLYHVVYSSGSDFEPLRCGNSFEESIRNLTEKAVHPDDQETAKQISRQQMEAFFENGETERNWIYRIYNQDSQIYKWYHINLLRIDTASPYQRMAMLVWHEKPVKQGEN